ncbi:MAG: family 16 glycosylhydrolase [Crocinitomicaceae bacterium]|nr:family 16 glycosylhydrolase [Crocinitomicaceae bacterium]
MSNSHLFTLTLLAIMLNNVPTALGQAVHDNFEGAGTISSWTGDDCNLNTSFSNPFVNAANPSATVLEYNDYGGQYGNVRFDVVTNFNLSINRTFSLQIYVPASSISGSQPNQVSLKLQDGTLGSPWTTQSEIIKPIVLDQWQTLNFDFGTDPFQNFDPGSIDPVYRTDFNRVLIQVNGENNNDLVIAYIDDFNYDGLLGSSPCDPIFNQLVWSDEFDTAGSIDSTKWHHQTQLPDGVSWYNSEVQHYTDRTDNSFVDSGYLHIIAKKEIFTDQGQTKNYTSARLNSKFAFTHGRVEVRAKLPTGTGTWPAIWMLGKNIIEPGGYWTASHGTTGWPACGEIDIMEHWGTNQNYIQSALHTPSSFGATVNHGGLAMSDVSNTFHTYAMEWNSESIRFSVDSNLFYVYAPDPKDMSNWPFVADQYILLNIAIQNIIDPAFIESPMIIDFVRVYQESAATVNSDTIEACDSYTWIDGNNYTANNSTATHTMISAEGCDSVINLELTINNSSTFEDIQEACETYTWIDGITYSTNNNTATQILTNSVGCDSVVNLNLTINTINDTLTQIGNTLTSNQIGAIYQWLYCDSSFSIIVGENAQTFTANTSGNYAVEIILNGCKDTSDCITISSVNLPEVLNDRIKIYPNPTSSIIHINTTGNSKANEVHLFDSAGRLIFNAFFESGNGIIDLNPYPSGVYQLHFYHEGKHITVVPVSKL